jgi:prepilin peptidase CpaA
MAGLTTFAFLTLVVLAAGADLRSRRIPNILTLTGLVTGLALRSAGGLGALADGVLGVGLAIVVAVPLFALGGLGGGDTKLLAAVGAFMGPSRLVGALLLIALLGGLMAVIDAGRRGVLAPVLTNCLMIMRSWIRPGGSGERQTISATGALTIPYGVAIAIGASAWWFWGGPVV